MHWKTFKNCKPFFIWTRQKARFARFLSWKDTEDGAGLSRNPHGALAPWAFCSQHWPAIFKQFRIKVILSCRIDYESFCWLLSPVEHVQASQSQKPGPGARSRAKYLLSTSRLGERGKKTAPCAAANPVHAPDLLPWTMRGPRI